MRHIASTLTLGLIFAAGCEPPTQFPEPTPITSDAELRQNLSNWGVIPIGQMPAQNPAKVALGQALFFDKILSGNRDVACATCHEPTASLGDGLSLAVGTGGVGRAPQRTLGPGRQFVPRQSPSLLNAGLGLNYMLWDGRLSGFGFGFGNGNGNGTFRLEPGEIFLSGLPNILAAQAMLPVLNRVEMRGEPGDTDVLGDPNELAVFADEEFLEVWNGLMTRLLAIPEYVQMFDAAFPGTPVGLLRFQDAADALATFQMDAFTRTDSPFDRYLDGDNVALSDEAKRGGLLFSGQAQCITCHSGPFIGGQDFANVGAPQIGPGIGGQMPLDLGRGELDDFDFYRFAFRVAPLRNVELTAPYMHSGAYATLEDVVEHYNDVPKAIREYDVSQLAPDVRDTYHGDASTVADIMSTLDFRLRSRQNFTESEKRELVAFLKSLTDPSARDLSAFIPASVPSGLPVP